MNNIAETSIPLNMYTNLASDKTQTKFIQQKYIQVPIGKNGITCNI